MWRSSWKKKYSYHICEIYSDNLAVCLYIKFSFCLYSIENVEIFVGQLCLCVTFTSWSTPSFGMLLSKLSNRNTHMCTSSIRMISFFNVQCELFTSCNVSNNASLLCAQGEGGGVVNQMWTDLDRGGQGAGGVPKIPKFVQISFMDDPYDNSKKKCL